MSKIIFFYYLHNFLRCRVDERIYECIIIVCNITDLNRIAEALSEPKALIPIATRP